MWELISRSINHVYLPPFYNCRHLGEYGIMFQVATQDLRPILPPSCPQSFIELYKDCVDKEVQKRPSVGILLSRIQKIEEEYSKNQKQWDNILSH